MTRWLVAAAALLPLGACGIDPLDPMAAKVDGGITDAWRVKAPDCIAVLRLAEDGQGGDVRRALHGHLAPQGKRDVELKRVDVEAGRTTDHKALGRALACTTLLEGRVTEDTTQYLGVWSRVAVGADIRLVRAEDGAVLWTGRHTVSSNGGTIPFSPIGLAMGIYDAARNMGDRIRLTLIHQLAQELVATIPDDVDAPAQDPVAVAPGAEPPATDLSPADRAARAFAEGDDAEALHQVNLALAETPRDGRMLALKGRILVHAGDYPGAETAFLETIAADPGRAEAYNSLGALALERGEAERAVAAFQMALEQDAGSGFAYHHLGVALRTGGDAAGAATAHYGAGLAYLKAGDFGRAARSLQFLKAANGSSEDVGVLEQALTRLAPANSAN